MSDVVNNFPIRKNIEVIPADDTKKHRIGWVCYETIGFPVYKPLEYLKDLELKEIFNIISSDVNIDVLLERISKSSLKKDDIIIVPSIFGGYYSAKVISLDDNQGSAESDNGNTLMLECCEVRKIWLCSCVINNKVIDKIKVSKT